MPLESYDPPAEWGVGTDGPVLNADGKYILPLNERGRAAAEGFMAKYKGMPERCLLSPAYRWLYKRAVSLLGADELRSAACEGVIRGARNYDPPPEIDYENYTYIVNAVFAYVRSRVTRVAVANARLPVVSEHYTSEGQRFMDTVEARPRPEVGVSEAILERYWRRLTVRERVVLVGTYLCRRTLKEVGELLGVSRDRVRQVQRSAVDRLRAWVRRDTRNTSGDDTHGSRECPRTSRPARSR